MSEEIENHTIRLLQEMRTEMRDLRTEVNDLRIDLRTGMADLRQRVDGNTLLLNLLAGLLQDHERRIVTLETRAS